MAEQTDKKVPRIHFKGFLGEWEDKALGDLFPITSAARVHKNEWTKSGVPFFRSSDVVSHFKGNDNTKAFISHELYQELSAKVGRIKKGDILVTGGGSIGIPYLVKTDEPLYFKDADLLWFKIREAVDSHYLYTFFCSEPFRRYLKSTSHIGTIAHYTVEQAKSTPLRLPKTTLEQTQIGEYFRELDGLIGLHQRKHDKLVTLKKAMLQKMFPQPGTTTPEIRFKGFEGDWKPYELGEITTKIGSGKTPSGGKTGYLTSGIPLIRSQNIFSDSVSLEGIAFISYETDEEMSNSQVLQNDVLLNITGASIGRSAVYRSGERANVNQHVCIIRAGGNHHSDFIQLNLASTRGQAVIDNNQAGGAREGLNFQQIGKFNFQFPSHTEQQKIGTYFRTLDALITQHATQLKKLQQLKSACLEKMFV